MSEKQHSREELAEAADAFASLGAKDTFEAMTQRAWAKARAKYDDRRDAEDDDDEDEE